MVNNENFKFKVDPKNFGWITGIMALGGFFGAPLAGYVRSILGTKMTTIVFCLPIIIGQIMIIYATNVAMVRYFYFYYFKSHAFYRAILFA